MSPSDDLEQGSRDVEGPRKATGSSRAAFAHANTAPGRCSDPNRSTNLESKVCKDIIFMLCRAFPWIGVVKDMVVAFLVRLDLAEQFIAVHSLRQEHVIA